MIINNLKTILLLLLISFSSILSAENLTDSYDYVYKKGVEYSKEGKQSLALNYFLRASKLKPYRTNPLTSAALASKDLNWFANAAHYFKKAIRVNNTEHNYGNLGSLYGEMGEDDLALENINKALELDPEYLYALNNKGAILHNNGKIKEAVSLWKTIEEKDAQFPHHFINLGSHYKVIGKLDSATIYYNKVLASFPNYIDALKMKANDKNLDTNELQKTNNDIIRIETKKLANNPNNFTSLINRGYAYKKKGEIDSMTIDLEKAIVILDELIELHPTAYQFLESRAIAYKRLGKDELAFEDYDKVLKINPYSLNSLAYLNKNEPNYLKNKIARLYKEEDYSTIISYSEIAEMLIPNDIMMNHYLSMSYYKLNKYDKALKIFKDNIEVAKNKEQWALHTAMANLGATYNVLGEYDLALPFINQSLELSPDYTVSLNNLGALFIKTGRYKEALEVLNEGLNYAPSDSYILDNIGETYKRMNKVDTALMYYNQALEKDPNFTYSLFSKMLLLNNTPSKKEEVENICYKIIDIESAALQKNNADYDKLIKRAVAYDLLNKQSLKEKDLYNALEILNEAIADYKTSPVLFEKRADVYKMLDEKLSATKDYKKALTLNPKSYEAIKYLSHQP